MSEEAIETNSARRMPAWWVWRGWRWLALLHWTVWVIVAANLLLSDDRTTKLLTVNTDDAYYYLAIAENISEGNGSTFDGIHRTNGHHPAWTWTLAAFSSLSSTRNDKVTVAKLAELLLIWIGGVALWRGLIRANVVSPLLFVLPLPLLNILSLTSGMESALLFACLSACLLLIQRSARLLSGFGWLSIGLMLGLLVLVRLEMVAFSLSGLGALWLMKPAQRTRIMLAALVVVSVFLSYLALNLEYFDHPVPISESVKSWWAAMENTAQDSYLSDRIVHALSQTRTWIVLLLIGAAIWQLLTARRAGHSGSQISLHGFIFALLAADLARMLYSIGFSSPTVGWYPWYFVAGDVAHGLAIIWLLPILWNRLKRLEWRFAVSVPVAVAWLLTQPLWPLERLSHKLDMGPPAWQVMSFEGAVIVDEQATRATRVGSPDSGVLQWYTKARVINLDGLVNPAWYLESLKQGQLDGAIDRLGITVFANVEPVDAPSPCERLPQIYGQPQPLSGSCQLVHAGEPRDADGRQRQFRIWPYERTDPLTD